MAHYNRPMRTYPINLLAATNWLRERDHVLSTLISEQPMPELQAHDDYYGALVSSIIGQQLSVKAAASIKRRFVDLFGGTMPMPSAIITRTHEELRSVGLSNAKANYIRDLAEHVLDGRVHFNNINSQSNAEIIAELSDVKGIGEWTVHMFLMFCVGRLDVLPTGDLGIRNAIRDRYGLATSPTPAEVRTLAETNGWHPYETVACLYLWASYDTEPFVPI